MNGSPVPMMADHCRRSPKHRRCTSNVYSVAAHAGFPSRSSGSCGEQLLGIGTGLFAVAAEEGVGMAFQRAAVGRDRPLAFAQIAFPGRRSESFIVFSSFRVVHAPQLTSARRPEPQRL